MLKGMPFWSRTGLPLAFFAANRRQALPRSEEHTSELQSQSNLVCRLLLEKKKKNLEDLRTAREETRDSLWNARTILGHVVIYVRAERHRGNIHRIAPTHTVHGNYLVPRNS